MVKLLGFLSVLLAVGCVLPSTQRHNALATYPQSVSGGTRELAGASLGLSSPGLGDDPIGKGESHDADLAKAGLTGDARYAWRANQGVVDFGLRFAHGRSSSVHRTRDAKATVDRDAYTGGLLAGYRVPIRGGRVVFRYAGGILVHRIPIVDGGPPEDELAPGSPGKFEGYRNHVAFMVNPNLGLEFAHGRIWVGGAVFTRPLLGQAGTAVSSSATGTLHPRLGLMASAGLEVDAGPAHLQLEVTQPYLASYELGPSITAGVSFDLGR
ncbi:MAG: hypothetical protein KJN97_04230 [Deltaproteobacteria bacterium]|nr:hypothetical protein [Deltaproteobacteria bacterium]